MSGICELVLELLSRVTGQTAGDCCSPGQVFCQALVSLFLKGPQRGTGWALLVTAGALAWMLQAAPILFYTAMQEHLLRYTREVGNQAVSNVAIVARFSQEGLPHQALLRKDASPRAGDTPGIALLRLLLCCALVCV